MMTHQEQLKNPLYRNWVKAGLGIKYLKEGLIDFVDNEVLTLKTDILEGIRITLGKPVVSCNQCTTENVLPCPSKGICKIEKRTCKYHGRADPLKSHRPCPLQVCDNIRDLVCQHHQYRKPSWKNTDASKWATNHWEIAKCFMAESGYQATTNAAETDCTGILSVLINCTFIQKKLSPYVSVKSFEEIRNTRNKIYHSGTMELSEGELYGYIDKMIYLLKNYLPCITPETQLAIDKLEKLKSQNLVTTNKDEEEVLKTIEECKRKALDDISKQRLSATEDIDSHKEGTEAAVDVKRQSAEAAVDEKRQCAEAAVDEKRQRAEAAVDDKRQRAEAAVDEKRQSAKEALDEHAQCAIDALEAAVDEQRQCVIDEISEHKQGAVKESMKEINKHKDIAVQEIRRSLSEETSKHKHHIIDWELEDKKFFTTKATKHVIKKLKESNCVVVTGISGSGKSSIIHHIALKLKDEEGYEVIPLFTNMPSELNDVRTPERNQLFVIDDLCGKVTVNRQQLDSWYDCLEKLENLLTRKQNESETGCMKILISCRLHIFRDPWFKGLSLFKSNECNLLSDDLRLSKEEREEMIKRFVPEYMIDHIQDLLQMPDNFPFLCRIAGNKRKSLTVEQLKSLFRQPEDDITDDLERFWTLNNKVQYCVIALCLLFDNNFNEEWLRNWHTTPAKIKEAVTELCIRCQINANTEASRLEISEYFESLNQTYVRKIGNMYGMIHDKMFEIAAKTCGKHLFECFINYASGMFLSDRCAFEYVEDKSESIAIVIPQGREGMYFTRLFRDMREGSLHNALHNNQLNCVRYRKKFLKYCRSHSEELKEILAKYSNTESKFTEIPLIEAVLSGYQDIVELLLDMGCVKQTDIRGRTALHAACQVGDVNIFKLLLKLRSSNIIRMNRTNYSPLKAACYRGHTGIVGMILDTDKNALQDTKSRSESLLLVACKRGYVELVELLLRYNIDTMMCNDLGETPLYAACCNGNSSIVQLLLSYGERNKTMKQMLFTCTVFRVSPLISACQHGFTEIVEELLQAGADTSLCDSEGDSPLSMACRHGHVDIARKFMQSYEDISRCNKQGESPLFIACKHGQANIVELLLQHGADISFHSEIENISLPEIAEQRGHTDVQRLLLEHREIAFVTHM